MGTSRTKSNNSACTVRTLSGLAFQPCLCPTLLNVCTSSSLYIFCCAPNVEHSPRHCTRFTHPANSGLSVLWPYWSPVHCRAWKVFPLGVGSRVANSWLIPTYHSGLSLSVKFSPSFTYQTGKNIQSRRVYKRKAFSYSLGGIQTSTIFLEGNLAIALKR